jgi:hypothetical protein
MAREDSKRVSTGRPIRQLALSAFLAMVCAASLVVAQPAKKALSDEDLNQLHAMLRQGDDWKTRSKAAKVLGALRRSKSVPHLIRCLRKDEDHLVRGACAWALGALEHPGSLADLHRIEKSGEPEFVKKQAKKALAHILSRYPRNLPAPGEGAYRVAVEGLRDRVNRGEELTPWIQQYFLEYLMAVEGVEVGTEMNIEEDGEVPDIEESFKPEVRVSFLGGIEAIDAPPDRGAGTIKVSLQVELKLQPVDRTAFARKTFVGRAEFAGGPPPDSAWDDDPLIEAQKAAVRDAVTKAYAEIAAAMKLK